jgi:hypothetical protein
MVKRKQKPKKPKGIIITIFRRTVLAGAIGTLIGLLTWCFHNTDSKCNRFWNNTRPVLETIFNSLEYFIENQFQELKKKESSERKAKPRKVFEAKIPKNIYNKMSKSIVEVRASSNKKIILSERMYEREILKGVGFIIRKNHFRAYIITAAHVVHNRLCEVRFFNTGLFSAVDVVFLDEQTDLAVLQVSTRSLPNPRSFEIKDELLKPGDYCWFFAANQNSEITPFRIWGKMIEKSKSVFKQKLHAYRKNRIGSVWFLISQSAQEGLSGSPVFSSTSEIVGVLIGGVEYEDRKVASVIVGVNEVKKIMANLETL